MRRSMAGSAGVLMLVMATGLAAQGGPPAQAQQQRQQQRMAQMQEMVQRMARIQTRLQGFDQALGQQMEQLRQRQQAREQAHLQQQAQVRDQQRLQQLQQTRQQERLHEQEQLRQHQRLQEMSRSMGQVTAQAQRNLERVRQMAGEPGVAQDRALRREMERLEAHWNRMADDLESALQSMEAVRNRLGGS